MARASSVNVIWAHTSSQLETAPLLSVFPTVPLDSIFLVAMAPMVVQELVWHAQTPLALISLAQASSWISAVQPLHARSAPLDSTTLDALVPTQELARPALVRTTQPSLSSGNISLSLARSTTRPAARKHIAIPRGARSGSTFPIVAQPTREPASTANRIALLLPPWLLALHHAIGTALPTHALPKSSWWDLDPLASAFSRLVRPISAPLATTSAAVGAPATVLACPAMLLPRVNGMTVQVSTLQAANLFLAKTVQSASIELVAAEATAAHVRLAPCLRPEATPPRMDTFRTTVPISHVAL